jgi:hypothetical protein
MFNSDVSIIVGVAAQSANPQTRPSRRKSISDSIIRLGQEYVGFVRKAQQEQSDNHSEIVREARELFLSGHFDSHEAMREAAQKIVEYGI